MTLTCKLKSYFDNRQKTEGNEDFLLNKVGTKENLQEPMTKDKITGTITKDKTLKTKSEEYLNYQTDMNLYMETTTQDQGQMT